MTKIGLCHLRRVLAIFQALLELSVGSCTGSASESASPTNVKNVTDALHRNRTYGAEEEQRARSPAFEFIVGEESCATGLQGYQLKARPMKASNDAAALSTQK